MKVAFTAASAGRAYFWPLGQFQCRILHMLKTNDKPLLEVEVEAARKRRLEAMALQEIEGNPLDADDIAMFEMFERERWSHEKVREYLLARSREDAAKPAK